MGYIKGITIEIDGETRGLDAALKKINSSTKSLQGELRRVENLLKLNPGSLDLVRQKQELLKKSISETKTKLDALRQAQKKMDAEGLDETNADYRRVQREIQETASKLKNLTAEQTRFNIQASKVGRLTSTLSAVGSKISAAGQKLKTATMAAGLLGGAAVTVGKEFDESMSKVQAVSGATGKDFDALRAKAREMGAKTKFSASEAAEAMNYMAMAGWKTNQMLEGVEGIMSLAAASGEDLATTSDIVTDALTAMGYAAEDSGRLADVMAAASSNANTNVGMMGETFKYAAAVAGAMNYSMEDVALATGLMANAGIKASQAGTSLRSVISRMAAPTKDVTGAMEQLGVNIENADGTTRPFRDVMVDLRNKMAGLTDVEKTQIANSIAGKNAMSGFLAIINASDQDFNKLASAIDNSDGAAEKMANTMINNFGGQLTILKSALQELAIGVSDTLTPAVRVLTSVIQGIVNWFNSLTDKQKQVAVSLAAFAAAIGPVLVAVGGLFTLSKNMVSAYGEMVVAFGKVKKVAGPAVNAMNAYRTSVKAATAASRTEQAVVKTNTALYGANAAGIYKTTTAKGIGATATRVYTKAQIALNRVLALGPWKLLAIGIGIAAAALAIFCASNEDARGKIADTFTAIKDKAVAAFSKLPEIFSAVTSAISAVLPQIAKAAAEAVPKIAQALEYGMPQMLQAGVNTILAVINGVSEALPGLTSSGVKILLSVINGITAALPRLMAVLPSIITTFVTGLMENLPRIITSAVQLVLALVNGITQNINLIVKAAVLLIGALIKGLIKSIPVLIKAVPKIIRALAKAIVTLGKSLASAGITIMKSFLSGIKTYAPTVISRAVSAVSSIPSKIKSGLGSLASIGSDLISGLWSGMSDKVGWLKGQISGFVGNVKSWLKKFFKIGSPSRLMADEVGKFIPSGIAMGIKDNMDVLRKAAKGMTEASLDSITVPARIPSAGSSAEPINYSMLAEAMKSALKGVEVSSTLQVDGKEVAKTTAPFMQGELNSIAKKANRRLGYV
ncbi:MAG: phage tail tape measure protein [Parasporobacterium sp.]|nr:phage tail tape measure protein [Parasporobacterium sp.]